MKEKRTITIVRLALILVLVLVLSSCGSKSVVGDWEVVNDGTVVTFQSDGTMLEDGAPCGTYETTKNHLTLMDEDGDATVFEMDLDENILSLTVSGEEDGQYGSYTMKLRKIS